MSKPVITLDKVIYEITLGGYSDPLNKTVVSNPISKSIDDKIYLSIDYNKVFGTWEDINTLLKYGFVIEKVERAGKTLRVIENATCEPRVVNMDL